MPTVLPAWPGNLRLAKSRWIRYLLAAKCRNTIGREDRGDLIVPGDTEPDTTVPRKSTTGLQQARSMGFGRRVSSAPAMATDRDGGGNVGQTGIHLEVVLFAGRERKMTTIRITREYNAVTGFDRATDALWDGRWVLEGPHTPSLQVRALGDAVKDCPDWRDTGLPRQSLLASPAIWRGDELVAAPWRGSENGWTASATGRGSFAQFLLSR